METVEELVFDTVVDEVSVEVLEGGVVPVIDTLEDSE